jgi:protein-tyrosine phosphatase
MHHDVNTHNDSRYSVCFVCSGNICRSPMGEIVLRRLVADAGLGDRVVVDSAGTGDWHIGEHADRRAVATLSAAGYDASRHRARQFDPHWFALRDLVIALDRGHERTLRGWAPHERDRAKVRLLRSFDPSVTSRAQGSELDVLDPYYDGDRAFDQVLEQVEAACRGLLDHIRSVMTDRVATG